MFCKREVDTGSAVTQPSVAGQFAGFTTGCIVVTYVASAPLELDACAVVGVRAAVD
jgi:hypothetical protein